MYYFLYFFSLALLCPKISSAVVDKDKGFTISGTTESNYEGYVYLEYNGKIDSTLVKDRLFSFVGSVESCTVASLKTKNGIFAGDVLYLENANLNLQIAIEEIGSGGSQAITTIESVSGSYTYDQLIPRILTLFGDGKLSESKAADFIDNLQSEIDKNPNHPLFAQLLIVIGELDSFTTSQLIACYKRLAVDDANQQDISQLAKVIEKRKKFSEGTRLMNFGFPDSLGMNHEVQDFYGQYLLIEFWDSACIPCRREHHALSNLYNLHRGKFAVLGISLDTNEKKWLDAVRQDNLKWVNVRCKDGFRNAIIQDLAIFGIPSNFLLDKDGKIVGINVSLETLEKLIVTL